jgi:putative transposase
MSKSRHTEAQMIGALKQLEGGHKAEDVAREGGVSKHTIYAWKAKYGGMDVNQAQEAKQLRDENMRLRKLVADLSLDKDALQWVIEKNGCPDIICVIKGQKVRILARLHRHHAMLIDPMYREEMTERPLRSSHPSQFW